MRAPHHLAESTAQSKFTSFVVLSVSLYDLALHAPLGAKAVFHMFLIITSLMTEAFYVDVIRMITSIGSEVGWPSPCSGRIGPTPHATLLKEQLQLLK